MPNNTSNVIDGCNCDDCVSARNESQSNIAVRTVQFAPSPVPSYNTVSIGYDTADNVIVSCNESNESNECNDNSIDEEEIHEESASNYLRTRNIMPTMLSMDILKKNMKPKSSSNKCLFCSSKKNTIVFNNICVCEKCTNIFFEKCHKCSCIYDKDDVFIVHDNKYCCNCLNNSGYRNCYHCHKWTSNTKEVKDVGFVCEECMNDSLYFRCKECHIFYKRERYGINNVCINCTNNKLTEVNNYSYKPCPKFYSKRYHANNVHDEKLFFGVELEMGGVDNPDIVNDFASDCSSTFFYMKKDTSIPVYGCEVVTQPATLQKHIDMAYWESLLRSAKDHGLSSDFDNCGVHVHISRDFFTTNECAKMDCFVNLYQEFWIKVARRESHYSTYVEKSVSSWGMQTSDRRCALNLSNPATIELRIFKGTLDYKILMSYIELCHALSMFAKRSNINDIIENKGKTLQLFKDIIYHSNYKFIPQYCERYNIF